MFSRTYLILPLIALLYGCPREGATGRPDTGVDPDAGMNTDGGTVTIGCENPAIDPAPNGETCSYTAGDDNTLIRGDIITPQGLLKNGHLLIDATGRIDCAACDCSQSARFASASVVACASGVVSPGLINTHEHLTFGEGMPINHDPERFEHRHDWREGQNQHTELPTPRSSDTDEAVLWAELRHLVAGATGVNGAGGVGGFLRNLDRNGLDEGLGVGTVRYSTFPLDDVRGTRRESTCDYGDLDAPTDMNIMRAIAYTPHIAEGIGVDARNEFSCLSGEGDMSTDVIMGKTAIIHGVGLLARDYIAMASEGASLIWSPRTNIDLYGHTAPVTLAANAGVRIALGTDWPASGSMNIARELACAAEYNQRNLASFFSDRQIVDMATQNAAEVLGVGSVVGRLEPGLFADVAVFNAAGNAEYQAIIKGEPANVALVMRAGDALYGDAELLAGLTAQDSGCEVVDICGTSKRLCAQRDTGFTLSQLRSAISPNTLDFFACGVPSGEPTCTPFRSNEFDGIALGGDMDGDGVLDAVDNCPMIFNAPRDDLDMGAQANADGDALGDVCDVCPLDADSTTCSMVDPDDRDNDTIPNSSDNCPDIANTDQADRDMDQIGDVCDQCPDESNIGGAPCSANVYNVKQGNVTGRVRLSNMLVTAASDRGYFLQTVDGDASWDPTLMERFSGIFIFNNMDPKPNPGDRVDVDGDVNDFFGQMQLENSSFTVVSSGDPLPAPIAANAADVATGGARAAELEAVLVSIGMVTVTAIQLDPGPGENPMEPTNEFEVEGILRVNDLLFLPEPPVAVDDVIGNLQGILRFANGNSKVEPRSAEDLGIPPRLQAIEPALAFARAGINAAVPPGGFAVVMSRAVTEDTNISLMSADAEVTVPGSVTIPTGSDRADIPVTAANPQAGPVTITASHDGVNVTGEIHVYDDAADRDVQAVSLDSASIATMGTAMGSVTLALPGAVGGTTVDLSVAPAALATVPATVTVAEDGLTMTFMLTAGTATGAGTLTAISGAGAPATFDFAVSDSITRPPTMVGDLVITEIHRNPSLSPAEENNEWVEIHNPTSDIIALDGVAIADNNDTHVLSTPGLLLQPGDYAVLAYNLAPANNGGVDAQAAYGADMLRLANGDDEVTISYQGTVIDFVDWGSGWPGGQGVAMCLRFPYPADNNVVSAWTDSVGSFGTGGDTGHPGVASDATNCP